MTSGTVYVTRKFAFSAAHRYWRPEWSAEENARVFGSLTVVHGHNYELDVTLAGPVDPVTGMVIDLSELKRMVHEVVISRFDHADLSADPMFAAAGQIATTENLVRAIWELLATKIGADRLYRLRLAEDPTLSVEYFGP